MQQRRDEILAKKAKLAELKRQRELRAREVSASRQSVGSGSDVIESILILESSLQAIACITYPRTSRKSKGA